MKKIQSSLNERQYARFRKLAQKLGLSEYLMVKKSVLWMLENYKSTDFAEGKI